MSKRTVLILLIGAVALVFAPGLLLFLPLFHPRVRTLVRRDSTVRAQCSRLAWILVVGLLLETHFPGIKLKGHVLIFDDDRHVSKHHSRSLASPKAA